MTLTNASLATAMGPLAGLVAALLHIVVVQAWQKLMEEMPEVCSIAESAWRRRSITTSHLHGSIDELYKLEHLSKRRTATTSGRDHGPREVPSTAIGEVTTAPAFRDNSWSQSTDLLPEVPQLQTRSANCGLAKVEQHPGVTPCRPPEAHDQGSQRFGRKREEPSQGNSHQDQSEAKDQARSEGRSLRGCSLHWRSGGCAGEAGRHHHGESSTQPGMHTLSTTPLGVDVQCSDQSTSLELQQPGLCPPLPRPATSPGLEDVSCLLSSGLCIAVGSPEDRP